MFEINPMFSIKSTRLEPLHVVTKPLEERRWFSQNDSSAYPK